ncbi:LysR family transcriptional regulator [Sphingomonas crocodyli]|uniref:LysR family transcriptional regulator n=2 Tax=Sphingomonas crocodyli TaxID=1979270 RepID=A0A437MBR1_9SPHN|nr:LysR family transcriptional regulator [Sphingomonas crocodyli]
MTQPALSQLIRDMEARLGFRLVERTTRKVLLTGPGRAFLADSEAILIKLERAIDSARAAAGQAANTIRIGAILPTAFEFLPAVLSEFRRRYPTAAIHIETRESAQLVTAVETGALNVALLRPPRNGGALRLETLRREAFVAAMRVDHPLARVELLQLRDLRPQKIVRISRGDLRDAFGEVDAQLERARLDLASSQAADATLTALARVSAGDGISFVPAWAASLPWKDVCFRQVQDLTATIDLAIAWDASSVPEIVQHFIDVARRIAR